MRRDPGPRFERRRRLIVALIGCVALAACSRSRDRAPPDEPSALAIGGGRADGADAFSMAPYRAPECARAWASLVDDMALGTAPDLARVVEPCSRAYCGRLPNPRPRTCVEDGARQPASLPDIAELDAAILRLEVGDAAAKRILAARAVFARAMVVTTPLDLPHRSTTPQTATLDIDVTAAGIRFGRDLVSDDELRTRVAAEVARSPDIRVAIHSATSVPYAVLVRVLDTLRAAGATKIAFAAAPSSAADDSANAAPSRP